MTITDSRPALYQKSKHAIWTDPHIQQQLLNKHLDLCSDEASRREESILMIIRFILGQTKPGSRLLDLGCGPGLYTERLADEKFVVTGIDFNRAAIEYAVGRRKQVEYLLGNYITDYPEGEFDCVTMIYCDMGTHSDCDRDLLLGKVYRSLSEGGVFIFDVFTEAIAHREQTNQGWVYEPNGGFWSATEYLLLSQTFHYPENKVYAYQYNLLLAQEAKHFIIWEKYYSEVEITEILKQAGFRKVFVYRNIAGQNSFTSDSEMFIVAEK